MQSQGAIADMYILTEIVLHLDPQRSNAEYRPVLWLSSTDVFSSLFLSISQSIYPFIRETVPWFCPSFRTWQNAWPRSTPVQSHYSPFINNLASISLTSLPSESCRRINKPGLNDPWHHICLCRWVHSGAICARQSVSSTGREAHSLCLTLS